MRILDLAKRFSEIFSGLARSGGRYVVPNDAKADSHGKVLGRAWTAHAPITLELWEAHLTGKQTTVTNEETNEPITGALGLGIVPIREDSFCIFGAIDIDQYAPPIDFGDLLKKIKHLKLPVIVCRTKSGGAHVYLFLKEPVNAELVRERLSEWAVALDHPDVEIFPKQALLSQYSDGSWINIPYSGGDRTVRYAFKADGTAMTAEEFVRAVGRAAITKDELEDFELPADVEDPRFEEGPPCLQTLARIGFGDWQNNGLFNIGIYLKLKHGDGWESHLARYNDEFMSPPCGPRELAGIAKSIKKKAYFYKCKDQPIAPVCNRTVCLKRKHGVGSGSGDSGVIFGELTRVLTDPVTWVWPIDGKEIELTTGELTDQRKFRSAVIEKLSKWPNPQPPEKWALMVKNLIESARSIFVPEDGTREGQFFEHLANFCVGRARARTLDEILRGTAFTDQKLGRTYFRSTDVFAYLAARRFVATEREVWRWLRHRGAEHHEKMIKGKFTNYWSVPAFPEQTEEHDVPRGAAVEM